MHRLRETLSSKRLLLAAETWFGSSGAGLAYGFRQHGFDVEEIDPTNYLPRSAGPVQRGLYRALRAPFAAAYNDAVVAAARRLQPRALLTVKGSYLTAATLDTLKSLGVPTIAFYPDVTFDHPGVDMEALRRFDWLYTAKSFHVPYLKAAFGHDRIRFLHHSYCPLTHRPRLASVSEDTFFTDVLLAGNHAPYKEQWVNALAERLPGVRFRILGNGWRGLSHGNTQVAGFALSGDGYARALQLAKINLAVHHGPVGPLGWQDFVSRRTFEVPACGGFMLHEDNAEVRALYDVGSEIDVFQSVDGLCAQIEHYLSHPDQRRLMAERAYQRCVPAYSSEKQAESIISSSGLFA